MLSQIHTILTMMLPISHSISASQQTWSGFPQTTVTGLSPTTVPEMSTGIFIHPSDNFEEDDRRNEEEITSFGESHIDNQPMV